MQYRITHIRVRPLALAAAIAAGLLLWLVAPAEAQLPTEAGTAAAVQPETEEISEGVTPAETSTEVEPTPADVEAAPVSSTASQAVDVVEEATREVAAETGAPVVGSVDAAAPAVAAEAHQTVAQTHEAVRDLTASTERSLQQAGAKLGDASPKPTVTPAAASGSAPAEKGAAEKPVDLTVSKDPPPSSPRSLAPHSGEEIEPLRAFWAAAGDRGPSADRPPIATVTPTPFLSMTTLEGGDVLSGGSPNGGSEEPAPANGGGSFQVPEMLSAAASGLGGSTFVPIAALLALLALVVPAIFRRLTEMADLSPPLPFACALERPG
jgi:hypothetical protein